MFEDIEIAASVRLKDDCLAVRRPGQREVVALVEREAARRRLQASAVRFELADVNVQVGGIPDEDQPLAVRASVGKLQEPGPIRESPGVAAALAGLGIELHFPKIGVHCGLGGLLKGAEDAAIL